MGLSLAQLRSSYAESKDVAQNLARNRYVADGAGVVPPQRLLVMLYDRLVLDLEQAEVAFSQSQIEIINDRLTHAQSIILALHGALDTEKWEAGQRLADLYVWFHDELIQVNVEKDKRRLQKVLLMVRDLKDSWTEAYTQNLANQSAT